MGERILNLMERRDRQRYPVPTPTAISLIAGGREYSGVIEDVSLCGARIRFDSPVTLAGPVEIAHSAVGRFHVIRISASRIESS